MRQLRLPWVVVTTRLNRCAIVRLRLMENLRTLAIEVGTGVSVGTVGNAMLTLWLSKQVMTTTVRPCLLRVRLQNSRVSRGSVRRLN